MITDATIRTAVPVTLIDLGPGMSVFTVPRPTCCSGDPVRLVNDSISVAPTTFVRGYHRSWVCSTCGHFFTDPVPYRTEWPRIRI